MSEKSFQSADLLFVQIQLCFVIKRQQSNSALKSLLRKQTGVVRFDKAKIQKAALANYPCSGVLGVHYPGAITYPG